MQALDFPSSGRFGRLWAGWTRAKFASDGPPGWQQSQALAPHITSDQFWKLYVKLKFFSNKSIAPFFKDLSLFD